MISPTYRLPEGETALPNKQAWLDLAQRLYEKGKAIFDHSDFLESAEGTRDPKVVALALLARTMGNFQAGVLLLETGHVVESRTMARCCYENFFWIASLAQTGEAFIKKMELDDAASRLKLANGLLDWSKAQSQKYDFAETLSSFYSSLRAKHGKGSRILPKDAANDGKISDAYIFYGELSNDAAHPSATSLSRHVSWDGDGDDVCFTLHALPLKEPFAIEDTLELACNALLCVCIATNEILGGSTDGERLATLADEFSKLSIENKTAREGARLLPPPKTRRS
ncbi:DUF5677 domain-containing protein [Rhodoblastus sp.]|uniref:DUF5677 domain-containing protein n=1 Tax=Rhodoblastus sp. TaxID=1962975 RepID=UPI0025F1F7D8|nr:DUF5677 domain-containing protein [Rhodoblastus sp.]